jgi:hypothetical protein
MRHKAAALTALKDEQKREVFHHCTILIRASLHAFYKIELALQADLYQASRQTGRDIRISCDLVKFSGSLVG